MRVPARDDRLEPSENVPRLPLLRASNAAPDAPPLLSHAQAGVEMQERAASDERLAEAEKAAQLAALSDLKHALTKTLPLLGVRLAARDASALAAHAAVQPHVFRSRRTKHIMPDTADPARRILQLGIMSADELPTEALDAIREAGGELVPHHVVLDWDYWTVDQILRAVLPAELEEGAPSAYSAIGHIAHVNLREEYLAYRYLIGQVILEKTPRIETVVNKLDTIDTEFRVFAMELLAGRPDYYAVVSESGCEFELDFRAVYWNSRLHTEHARIISKFKQNQVIADVMAGIGPFAVPAAKRLCWVLANDLNPTCYEGLLANSARNNARRVESSCMDGRAFIEHAVNRAWDASFPSRPSEEEQQSGRSRRKAQRARTKAAEGAAKDTAGAAGPQGQPDAQNEPAGQPGATGGPEAAGQGDAQASVGAAPSAQTQLVPGPRRLIDHFVMNLPATAIEFLDAFRGVYTRLEARVGSALAEELQSRANDSEVEPLPMVHVHCFTKALDAPGEDICERASDALGLGKGERLVPPGKDNATPDLSLHLVRSVAPNKDMYCLSFRLPRSVLFA
ncbi:tRNA (guanine(37)-N(1))-methyltransferase [Malassezia cuniculi]|uniref:tRNA (guanine(37)-N1)-methyltransferase n=1 Tax=Malassezia cuniculi TaxID=948313 RepID=A0AAF0J7V9_9BASI|nr:tRNA (guanine(37)-N(1))-methyltransferase [Malassezia cuniculi]